MHHRGDELDLLGHTLGKLLNLFVPPAFDAELNKPFLELDHSLSLAHALELSKIHGLLTDFHLAVQSPLLREISDFLDIVLGYWFSLEQDAS